MPLPKRVGLFAGPWLAFAAFSGLGGSLIFGLPFLILGSTIALLSLVLDLFKAVAEISGSFFEFCQSLLLLTAVGFWGGFLTGLTTALMRHRVGRWWSFLSCYLVLCLANSHFPPSPDLAIFFPFVACGAFIPNDLLTKGASRYRWKESWRHWMQTSWLSNPPRAAQVAGIFSPLLLLLAMNTTGTSLEYAKHQNYVARYGEWDVWVRSWQASPIYNYGNRSDCQENLQQIMMAVNQYVQDSDGELPIAPTSFKNGVCVVIQPYLHSTRVFQCPSEFYNDTGNFAGGDFTDYWYNSRCYGLNQSAMREMSSTVLWGDGNTGRGEANAAYSLSSLPVNFPPAMRHKDGANYAFVDGHVKWFKNGFVANKKPFVESYPTLVP